MKYSEIDRFSESHDATLANITAILYERLGCTQDESYDYILEKLQEIKVFDSGNTLENAEWNAANRKKQVKSRGGEIWVNPCYPNSSEPNPEAHGVYAYMWKIKHGLTKENLDGTS